jgi:hypothetical protein
VNHPSPVHQQIELRAYQLWQERGQPWGTPEIDWFEAEHELTELGVKTALVSLAREVGTVIGNVVSFLTDAKTAPHDLPDTTTS